MCHINHILCKYFGKFCICFIFCEICLVFAFFGQNPFHLAKPLSSGVTKQRNFITINNRQGFIPIVAVVVVIIIINSKYLVLMTDSQ